MKLEDAISGLEDQAYAADLSGDIAFRDTCLLLAAWLSELKARRASKELFKCGNCFKYDSHKHRCKHWNHGVGVNSFCSYAEPKGAR